MHVIGLTGGIASGKSTIGRRLEALGAVRIDADQLARDAVAVGTPGLTQISDRFGADSVLAEDGSLDRAALGAVVFSDPEALAALNSIVHPQVQRLYEAAVAAAGARDPHSIVVYEVPLLAELQRDFGFDRIVVAEAPTETRLARMVELRGMTEQDARARLANQASDTQRREIADEIIDTSGTEADTLRQVDALWARLQAAARGGD